MLIKCKGCMEEYDDSFGICPHCGYIPGSKAEESIHMDPGMRLHNRYTLGRVLGYGGLGVTYAAWDDTLDQKVAIKEYLPGEFSTRMPDTAQVKVFSGEKNEQFRSGMARFVAEAKNLARFQNEEGIVKIFDSFEENNTAYIVMEYLDGETLTDYLNRVGTIPEDTAVDMLMPVMRSLDVVNKAGLLHRDIAPDNIFLTTSGKVKLIDFGAARYATTTHSRSLTVIIKPGFSPEEQYRSRGDQGPHTDVYALGATLYKMITGVTPPDAMDRRTKYESKSQDILVEPHRLTKKISRGREIAILNALNVRIEDRTENVRNFINELNADPPVKRRYGKIKKIDIYHWPLWLKVALPSVVGAAAVFVVLMLTGVINFSLFTRDVVVPENVAIVPDVEGQTQNQAVTIVEKQNLLAETGGTVESRYLPAGEIVLQTPSGGSYLDVNSVVTLVVSSGSGVEGPVDGISTVPFITWDTLEDAKRKLELAGLGEPETEERCDDTVAEGCVISQSIEAGEKVEEGTVLKLVISLGAKPFEMPDVAGKSQNEAKKALEDAGLQVQISLKYDKNVKNGDVISHDPSPGTKVKRGDVVTLVVSSGEETVSVPDVTGMKSDAAVAALTDKGFVPSVMESYSSEAADGTVYNQNPKGNTSQARGSSVTLFVSKGSKPSETATPVPTRVPTAAPTSAPTAAPTRVPTAAPTAAPVPTYSVIFDPNGGSVSQGSKTVTKGSSYGSLPNASMAYYTFDGWYTSPSGGNRITADSTVSISGDQVLYAHYSLNPESGWVSEYSVPAGAQITQKKYTYDETSYKTSQTMESGWTVYNTESSWSGYGSWSGWSTEPAYNSDSRAVETRYIVDGYYVNCYLTRGLDEYRQYRSYSLGGNYEAYGCSRRYGEFDYTGVYYSVGEWDSFTPVGEGQYFNISPKTNGYNKGSGTGYAGPDGIIRFKGQEAGHTEYRYRDRSQITTYYLSKTVSKESTSYPSSGNISNVQTFVRYRPQ